MHGITLLILVIGLTGPGLASAEGEISDDGGSVHKGMVLVEQNEPVKVEPDGEIEARDYRERRRTWGVNVSAGYSTYEPLNYIPQETGDAVTSDGTIQFGTVYSKPDTPLLELQVNVKRNVEFGSLAGEIGVGYYKNNADQAAVASTLTLTPIRLGLTFAADVIWREPFVVPFVTAGVYVINFREEGETDSVGGTTKAAPYFNLGAMVQLDMIDRRSARVAYEETGLQSTFLFFEVRKFMASSSGEDPDMSNSYSLGAGLRLEF